MTYQLHQGDLPEGLDFGTTVAIDTEAMGLNPHRDRLCLVQLSAGDGDAHLVQLAPGAYAAPRLRQLLTDREVTKLFHFARFDLAMLYRYLGVMAHPVYCTKIASRLVRTFTDRHGLRDLCKDLLSVEVSKQQQSSDWGAQTLSAGRCATPPRTCSISMRCAPGSIRCWLARGAWRLLAHALNSCRIAFCLISKAGRSKTSSRISGTVGGGISVGADRCKPAGLAGDDRRGWGRVEFGALRTR